MAELNLPPDFIRNIQNSFGEAGRIFIENLPDLIKDISARWNLMDVQPVPNLSYNFVAFAKRDKKDVILKIGIPNPELNSEMAALKLFNGEGACQLLACDEECGFLLLERLNPGTVLADLTDDDERTNIAISVMQRIWREVPSASPAQAAVRNIVDFGAFIDIGVKQDGLLHKSQIPNGTVLKVGDIIDIEIQKIEAERGRIGLGWVK